ncbi:MAG: monovalent cation/H(+) antiporter subunit G [Planctomycetaceae bacterium]|nr:monovalent cation/H(+) antiporter subunit G [Planctomycetaceae bacterium]
MTEVLVAVLLLIGSLLMLLAGVGILRMPDLYMRLGTSTKASTLGLACILTAVAVHFAQMGVSTRAIAAVVFIFLTAPIAAHMIGRAAYVVGVSMWDRTVFDELQGRREPTPSESPDEIANREDGHPASRDGRTPGA